MYYQIKRYKCCDKDQGWAICPFLKIYNAIYMHKKRGCTTNFLQFIAFINLHPHNEWDLGQYTQIQNCWNASWDYNSKWNALQTRNANKPANPVADDAVANFFVEVFSILKVNIHKT